MLIKIAAEGTFSVDSSHNLSLTLAKQNAGSIQISSGVNIEPDVSVNTDVSPPTISVAVNGITSTANLPTSTFNLSTLASIYDSNIATILTKLNGYKGKLIYMTIRGFRTDESGSDNYNYLTFSGVINSVTTSSISINGSGFIARNDFNNRANTTFIAVYNNYIRIDTNTTVGSAYSKGLWVELHSLSIVDIRVVG